MGAAGLPGDRVSLRRRLQGLALAILLGTCLWGGALPAWAELPQGNAVKDPEAILRNALPIDAPQLQSLQHRLESTSDDLRAKRWKPLAGTVTRAQAQLTTQKATILESLWRLRHDKGMSLVYVTHDLATAYQIADSIVVMRDGEIVEAGAAEATIRAPRHPYTRALLAALPPADPTIGWALDDESAHPSPKEERS